MKLSKLLLATSILAVSAAGSLFNPALATSSSSEAQPSVMIVDYEKLVKSSALFAKANQSFESKFASRIEDANKTELELKDENNALIKLKENLDKDLATGKLVGADLKKRESELKSRSEAFQSKVQQFEQSQQNLHKEIESYQAATLSKLEKDIRAIVDQYAKDNNIPLVLDVKAAIYFSNSVDLTNKLLEKVK